MIRWILFIILIAAVINLTPLKYVVGLVVIILSLGGLAQIGHEIWIRLFDKK